MTGNLTAVDRSEKKRLPTSIQLHESQEKTKKGGAAIQPLLNRITVSGREDLNLRPLGPEPSALAPALLPVKMIL